MFIAAREAVERARNGEGPTLIEARTFRFHGHNFGDPGTYIPKDVYQRAVADDPMPKLRRRLIEQGVLSEAAVAAIEAETDAMLTDAVEFAKASRQPDPEAVMTDIYANGMELA
jgi:pyruvate dehydrogenase E1 component alpha subunit